MTLSGQGQTQEHNWDNRYSWSDTGAFGAEVGKGRAGGGEGAEREGRTKGNAWAAPSSLQPQEAFGDPSSGLGWVSNSILDVTFLSQHLLL